MQESLLNKIDSNNIPKHVAIILDGNGRWAKKRFLPRFKGHQEGMKRVVEIVEVASNIGIEFLSVYAFSTENWKRPVLEVNSLMDLLVYYVEIQLDKLKKNNVKVITLGDISKLPTKAKNAIVKACNETSTNTGMVLNIALNYGGRDDIVNATKNILEDFNLGKININNIDEDIFKNYLYTTNQPDVDLLIRSGGDMRLSNFLLYQTAYAELYFTNCLWPDFKEDELFKAIIDYQSRNRRFGGV
ncbi:isoprenyl transferase [Miniphocaeibacter halophilus]|uniref:Isoprenyl transferase n=1 Tax=Miniphocaeibacter halophilus TaxID=2931922 RepID=A0AC61MTF6_9FIRM|nr:isoprenyl transferase [Miniphocaeibacter halophilus]QQK07681.1 isoprenyl transferase [Miniphocaeibacter halophilus]